MAVELKRAQDLLFCLCVFPLSAIVIGVLGLLVRLESGRPVFYRQTRVGRHRRSFTLFKLRSMLSDGTQKQFLVTASDDARVTRLGTVLRRFALDELPQVWNVIRGDMSVVGPRPEIPRFVREYAPEWDEVFHVRPGLTDLTSIVFRNEEQLLAGSSDPEQLYIDILLPIKMQVTLECLQCTSLRYDFMIVLKTIGTLTGILSFDQHPALLDARRQIRKRVGREREA